MARERIQLAGRLLEALSPRLYRLIQSVRLRLHFIEPAPPPRPFSDLLSGGFPLCSHWWRFCRGNGDLLAERMRFLPDGSILGAAHPNEHGWKIQTGDALHILSATGETTTIFDRIDWIGPAPTLSGRFVQDQDLIHILTPNLEDMHVEIFQTKFRGGMLIIPTSRGRPFDGVTTRWELWHLPREAGIDHMRLAEHNDSKCWYTNKTIRIMQQLRVFVALGYRSFCFFGLSSGGYAALLLAELLAAEYPGLKISSVSINPQTRLGDEVPEHFALANISPLFWPELITSEDLSQRDIAVFNIADLIRNAARKSAVQHHVFHDAENPCEAYFIEQIDNLSGVMLHRYSHGLQHAAGIGKIYEDNRAEIESLILGSLDPGNLGPVRGRYASCNAAR